MKCEIAPIIGNTKVGPGYYRLVVRASGIARSIRPGQFLHVRCSGSLDPFLRRPFSVHRVRPPSVEILYKVVGEGTEALSAKRPGDRLDIIGPLGNGFTFKRITNHEPRTTILIAGGTGVASLMALADRFTGSRVHGFAGLKVLLGACTKSHILCEKDFKKLGADVRISTDDGSKGKKGLVTDLLKDFLRITNHEPRITIFACGPHAMLKEVARIAKGRAIPCYVSLEERMACGVGACLGCAVKVRNTDVRRSSFVDRDSSEKQEHESRITNPESQSPNYGYKMVCKDGPVFDAAEVVWE